SLLIQVKTRIENLSRTTSFRQHRSSVHGVKRGPTDTYGCVRFQPDLPLEEMDELN
ncbi:mpv17-like protein 2 isoform X1, partial [Tachysurus ichikawai]